MSEATRLPPALPGPAVAATAATMAAPGSSPTLQVCVWRLTVRASAWMSLASSGSAALCQVAMSPAGRRRQPVSPAGLVRWRAHTHSGALAAPILAHPQG